MRCQKIEDYNFCFCQNSWARFYAQCGGSRIRGKKIVSHTFRFKSKIISVAAFLICAIAMIFGACAVLRIHSFHGVELPQTGETEKSLLRGLRNPIIYFWLLPKDYPCFILPNNNRYGYSKSFLQLFLCLNPILLHLNLGGMFFVRNPFRVYIHFWYSATYLPLGIQRKNLHAFGV